MAGRTQASMTAYLGARQAAAQRAMAWTVTSRAHGTPRVDASIELLPTALASGEFGNVWLGTRATGDPDQPRQQVIVKVFPAGAVASFMTEMVAQQMLQHADPSLCAAEAVACATEALVTPDLALAIVFPFQTVQTFKVFAGRALADWVLVTAAAGLVRSVARLHAGGMAHLDLKPDNVLVLGPRRDRGGGPGPAGTVAVLLIDFGLACVWRGLLAQQREAAAAAKAVLQTDLAAYLADTPASNERRIFRIRELQGAIQALNVEAELACKIDRGSGAYMNPALKGRTGIGAAQWEDAYSLGLTLFALMRGRPLEDDDAYLEADAEASDPDYGAAVYVVDYLDRNEARVDPVMAAVIRVLVSTPVPAAASSTDLTTALAGLLVQAQTDLAVQAVALRAAGRAALRAPLS